MKAPRAFGQLLAVTAALSSTVTAWPSWLPEIDALVVRQESASSTAPFATPSRTADSTASPTASGTSTQNNNDPKTTNLNTGGLSQTGSVTGSATGTGSKNGTQTTRATFNAQDPAGGIAMITPATTTGTVLYRIGETITFVWNYTSLQGTPTALDVLVTCTSASLKWTLTQNMTYEATGTYTWDTNKYRQTAVQSPLVNQEYALIIYDSDGTQTSVAQAGYLAPFDRLKFGLYTSEPYSNLSEWKCATCSAANSDMERRALGFALTMATITILSFTWFVTGFGALL